MEEKIEELEKAIAQRMNALAAQDPQCQRWMGALEAYRDVKPDPPDLKIEAEE